MFKRAALLVAHERPMARLLVQEASGFAIPKAIQRRTFLKSRSNGAHGAYDTLNVERLTRERRDYDRTWLIFLTTGSVAGLIAMGCTAWRIKQVLEENPKKLDSTGTVSQNLTSRKVVVHDKDGREIVPTGNSIVTEFPRTVDLQPKLLQEGLDTEYTLVGLGTRCVSFLNIQVYVVGFYVATADISALQSRLIKSINPIATALVSGEKDKLRNSLLDPDDSQALWEALLEEGMPARSLFRIVPVRDTDFPHLRDGFVRAIQARAPRILEKEKEQQKDEGAPEFGESMRAFRHAFNRGKAPKKHELLMVRAADGVLSVVFDDGRSMGRQLLGSVDDERVSRALWMNYLAGKKVASDEARQSIADGIVEFVERPVGTVATQVV